MPIVPPIHGKGIQPKDKCFLCRGANPKEYQMFLTIIGTKKKHNGLFGDGFMFCDNCVNSIEDGNVFTIVDNIELVEAI